MVGGFVKKEKVTTTGVTIILLLSIFFTVGLMQDNVIQSDILIIQIGNDDATTSTSNIILNTISTIKIEERDYKVKMTNGIRYNSLMSDSIYGTQSFTFTPQGFSVQVSMVESSTLTVKGDINNYRASVLIIVGHGSEKGIGDKTNHDNLMNWANLISVTDIIGSKFTILACCYSSNAIEYRRNIIGFKEEIDAALAGYLVSFLLAQMIPNTPKSINDVLLEKSMNRLDLLSRNPHAYVPLSIKSDWAALRVSLIATLTGIFFVGAYFIKWQSLGLLGALLAYSAGFAVGYVFQLFLEWLRIYVGGPLMTMNPTMGCSFNAIIGFLLGFVVSYSSPFLLPSFMAAVLYVVSGTTAALALSDTPEPWIRIAAATSAAIGVISIFDMIIQFV